MLPISRLASIAHRHGARILVDAAQLVAHQPISVVSHGIDYLVFSGHKLYAPFGAGFWWAAVTGWTGLRRTWPVAARARRWRPAERCSGIPDRPGTRPDRPTSSVRYPSPTRESLSVIGFEAIGYHEHTLRERLDAGLAAIDGVRPLRIFSDSTGRVGIAGFAVDGLSARTVACYLSDHHGIGVRDGRFCTHPLLTRLGYPDGAVRASFGLGTAADDIDRLLNALSELVSRRDTARVKSLG